MGKVACQVRVAKLSYADFQSVGLESKNTSFVSPGTVSEPTVACRVFLHIVAVKTIEHPVK